MNIGFLPPAGNSTVIMSDSSLYQLPGMILTSSFSSSSVAEVCNAISGETRDATRIDRIMDASQFLFVFKVFHQKRLGKRLF